MMAPSGKTPKAKKTFVKVERQPEAEKKKIEDKKNSRAGGFLRPANVDMDGEGFYDFYAVAVGRKPGIYSHWDEAKAQITGFPGCKHDKFMKRSDAIDFMKANGIPEFEIRLFRKSFKPSPTFNPNPTATFNQEFKAFAASQKLNEDQKRTAKITTIMTDLIAHYLPEGIAPDQEDEEGEVDLTDRQMLKIYRGMCRSVNKPIHDTINQCLRELNRKPYTNILDFLDSFRLGGVVRTFPDWSEFRRYTKKGRCIDVKYARRNEFLAPLLQDLDQGPGAVDPIEVRKAFQAKKAALKRRRVEESLAAILEESSCVPKISLSPPPSDFSPTSSRSSTPELVFSTPDSSRKDSETSEHDTSWKTTILASAIASTPQEPAVFITPARQTGLLDFSVGDEPPQSSQMEERHYSSTAPVLGKRTRDSSSGVETIQKRTRMTRSQGVVP